MLQQRLTSSIEVVRQYLLLSEADGRPHDADGLVSAHAAELRRRVRRLQETAPDADVRLSPCVKELLVDEPARQEAWG